MIAGWGVGNVDVPKLLVVGAPTGLACCPKLRVDCRPAFADGAWGKKGVG